MMASASPAGISAQQTTRPEKNSRGSGLYCRGLARRPFVTDASIQSGLTTGMRASLTLS